MTANNLTYGAFGDELGYWRFFPAPEGWGRIPVWGFGEVLASEVEGLGPGDRFYGYFPMADVATMRVRATPSGFSDASEQRAELPAFYNRYLRAVPELGFAPGHDDANAVMRPLFMTGWLIADLLEEAGFHGAGTVVLASASSKTAFATAFELAAREERPEVVGLTSPGNLGFTEGLGCYDRVLTYDDLAELPVEDGLVLVDMAGTPALRRALHEHAGDALRASIVVGATHWDDASLTPEDLAGTPSQFFFAPTRAAERAAELTPAVLQMRIGMAWLAFAERLPDLLEFETHEGPEALGRVYDAFVTGDADPRKGYVVSL